MLIRRVSRCGGFAVLRLQGSTGWVRVLKGKRTGGLACRRASVDHSLMALDQSASVRGRLASKVRASADSGERHWRDTL